MKKMSGTIRRHIFCCFRPKTGRYGLRYEMPKIGMYLRPLGVAQRIDNIGQFRKSYRGSYRAYRPQRYDLGSISLGGRTVPLISLLGTAVRSVREIAP